LTVLAQPWWDRFPGRFEYELALLRAAGMAPLVDEAAKAAGLARVSVTLDVAGEGPVELMATFPDLYPYFRPEVSAPSLNLPHHQHPFSKYLCLLGRSTGNWSTGDSLAALLNQQLAKAVHAGSATAPAAEQRAALPEEHQAEPYSDYYTYAPGVMLMIDGGWNLPKDATHGQLTLGLGGSLLPSDHAQAHTLGAVLEVRDQTDAIVGAAPAPLAGRFPGDAKARWSRLGASVASNDAQVLWDAAAAADPEGDPRPIASSLRSAPPLQVRAVVFPEEVAWRVSGDGWVFVVRRAGTTHQVRPSKKRGIAAANKQTPGSYWLVRVGRAGPTDLAARVPELSGLAERRVVLVGAGALGGTIADQLARAGIGRLITIDRDVLEPGNTVRHAANYLHSGRLKAIAVAAVAADRSPYLESQFNALPLGLVRTEPAGATDGQALDDALHGAHLLIDATAELGVQHLLADEATRRGIPYLCVTATNGAWGGMVTLIAPGKTTGCWTCLMHHLEDKTILAPPAAPTDLVQPPGCANPTFTGTGFDVDQISLHAVRVAVATLLAGRPAAYPSPPSDVAVLSLRDGDGNPTLPMWTGHLLERHSTCVSH